MNILEKGFLNKFGKVSKKNKKFSEILVIIQKYENNMEYVHRNHLKMNVFVTTCT